jgi:hypothetical protein
MKAVLLIIIFHYSGNGGLTTNHIPVKDYDYCISIADQTGKSIAESIGNYADSISTECIRTEP